MFCFDFDERDLLVERSVCVTVSNCRGSRVRRRASVRLAASSGRHKAVGSRVDPLFEMRDARVEKWASWSTSLRGEAHRLPWLAHCLVAMQRQPSREEL